MTFTEWMAKLQGDKTQVEFAEQLGIAQSYLSEVYADKRKLGKKLLVGMVKAFPQYKRELTDSFFATEYDSIDDDMTESDTEEA